MDLCQAYDWCRLPLEPTLYSFGDGRGNIYRKCGAGHWTPKPPPPDIQAIDDWSDEDD